MNANDGISPEAKEHFTHPKLLRKGEAVGYCFFCDEPATSLKPLYKTAT